VPEQRLARHRISQSEETVMGDIVNLNRARKARARAEAVTAAAANRAAHGRTRAEREAADRERERVARLLDGSRRED
jgi:hypothetical protein